MLTVSRENQKRKISTIAKLDRSHSDRTVTPMKLPIYIYFSTRQAASTLKATFDIILPWTWICPCPY